VYDSLKMQPVLLMGIIQASMVNGVVAVVIENKAVPDKDRKSELPLK
jgi:hypothetical protein